MNPEKNSSFSAAPRAPQRPRILARKDRAAPPAEPVLTRPGPHQAHAMKPASTEALAWDAEQDYRLDDEPHRTRRAFGNAWSDRAFALIIGVAVVGTASLELFGDNPLGLGQTEQPIREIVETSLEAPVMSDLDIAFAAPEPAPSPVMAPATQPAAATDIRLIEPESAAPALLDSLGVAGLGRAPQQDAGPARPALTDGVEVASLDPAYPALPSNAPATIPALPAGTDLPELLLAVTAPGGDLEFAAGPALPALPAAAPLRLALAETGLGSPQSGPLGMEELRRAALNPAAPPLDLGGLQVRVHSPDGLDPEEMALLTLDLAGTGAQLIDPVHSGFSVSTAHIRVYHSEFQPKAQVLADFLGMELRSFTNLAAKPRRGVVEIWMEGIPPQAIAARQQRRALAAQAAAAGGVAPDAAQAGILPGNRIQTAASDPNRDSDLDKLPWWMRLGLVRPTTTASATASATGNGNGNGNGGGNGGGNGNSGGNGNGNGNGGGGNGNGNGNN